MHGCDLMINVGARFDDRITGRLDAFSPKSKKAHIDIDPSSINKVIRVDMPIIGDVGHVLEDILKVWKARGRKVNNEALQKWWSQIDKWRAVDCLKYKTHRRESIQARNMPWSGFSELTKRRDDLHHHGSRPAPDVGGAVLSRFERAEPLDDLRRPRHDGLRPAGVLSVCKWRIRMRW